MDWYVVIARPQREADASYWLRRRGIEVFWPRCWHTWSRDGHTTSELRSYFPPYLFAAGSIAAIRSTPHVLDVICEAGEVYTLSLETMMRLRSLFDPDGVQPPSPRTAKHLRKVLRTVKPDLRAHFIATLDRLDDNGRMRVQKHRAVRLTEIGKSYEYAI